NMDKLKRDAQIISVHKPRFLIKLIACLDAIWAFLIGIPFLLITALMGIGGAWIAYLAFLFALFIILDKCWYAILVTTQILLIVYNDGLALQRGKSYLFATWENMSHLERFAWGSPNYGIFLNEMVGLEREGVLEKIFFGRAKDFL